MNGLNRVFLNDPAYFLTSCALRVLAVANPMNKSKTEGEFMRTAGVHFFDLIDDVTKPPTPRDQFDVAFFPMHSTAYQTDFPITAYWLPWAGESAIEMDLNHKEDPDIFFTAGLSGCHFVVSGDPQRPHVAHNNYQGSKILPLTITETDERGRAVMKDVVGRGKMNNMSLGLPDPSAIPKVQGPKPMSASGRSYGTFSSALADPAPDPMTGYVEMAKEREQGINASTKHLRSQLMQELKGVTQARQAGVGSILGTVTWADYGLHQDRDHGAQASVVGYRNRLTMNWHFLFQIHSITYSWVGTGRMMNIQSKKDPIEETRQAQSVQLLDTLCVICKQKPGNCVCPP